MRCLLLSVEPMKRGFASMFKDHNPSFTFEVKRFDSGSWTIHRSINDFNVLYEHLLAKHPDSVVPAVPLMSKSKDHDDMLYLDKLGKMLTKFLENCFLAPSIRSN